MTNFFKDRRSAIFAAAGIAAVLLYYLARMARGRRFQDLVFNSMAEYLFQGRFDVDPEIIGFEAFLRDGRSYAYFGVFPALARLCLVPFFEITTLPLGRIYTCLALFLGAFAQVASVIVAFRVMPPGPTSEAIRPRLVLLALLSGPPILIGMSSTVYDESISWAWAQAALFVMLVLHGLTRTEGFTPAVLGSLAAVAGLALLTRVTTAIGLFAALVFLLLYLLLQCEAGKRPGLKLFFARLLRPRIVVPLAVLIVFIMIAGLVNLARWGDPFTFADIRAQEHLMRQYPDRLVRFENYGLFNFNRIGYGLIYYFFPVWFLPGEKGGLLFEKRILELFDAFELPPSSFFLTDPLTMILAVIGFLTIVRGRTGAIPRASLIVVLAGLAVPPALMLSAWYMAFRYRLEFMPLISLLAALGSLAWLHWADRAPAKRVKRAGQLFLILFLFQIVSAHVHSYLYISSHFGPSHSRIRSGIVAYYGERIPGLRVLP